jgi:hypothetical protein
MSFDGEDVHLVGENNMSANRPLLVKVAVLLAVVWLGFGAISGIEIIRHWIDGSSDVRSQFLRIFSIGIFAVCAIGLLLRFPTWRWVVAVPLVLIGIRDYFYLMVPVELSWGFDQILSAIRLGVTLISMTMVALWGRLGGRLPNNGTSAPQ